MNWLTVTSVLRQLNFLKKKLIFRNREEIHGKSQHLTKIAASMICVFRWFSIVPTYVTYTWITLYHVQSPDAQLTCVKMSLNYIWWITVYLSSTGTPYWRWRPGRSGEAKSSRELVTCCAVSTWSLISSNSAKLRSSSRTQNRFVYRQLLSFSTIQCSELFKCLVMSQCIWSTVHYMSRAGSGSCGFLLE